MQFSGKIFVSLAIILALMVGGNIYADTLSDEARLDPALIKGPVETVTEVLAGDLLKLQDGRTVKILGIDIPNSYAAQAKKYVGEFSGLDHSPSAQVQIFYGTAKQDRYGRILAYPFTMDGLSYAHAIVQQGHARALSAPDNRVIAAELMALDRDARGYGNGLWALPEFKVLTPEQVLDKKYWDQVQVVEGKVLYTAEVKKTIYLDFDIDWKKDFTAVIPPTARALFTAAKIKPKDLEGIRVRVRGFVENKNGPSITLTHPELLEILEPAPTAKPVKGKRTRQKKT
ncbi:MAG: thermonuclease family protein [Alphaproteobacteria bacterium]|nr:MAG: thermonuclease family protein [Alphaproteobacteria bacterium]